MTRTRALTLAASALALIATAATVAGCDRHPATPTAEYAVYAEYALTNKPVVPGWNTRVFNTREVQEGQSISLDDKTGVVTLQPGRYHITASSIVNYYDSANLTTIPMNPTPAAGYARLRRLEDATPPNAKPTLHLINSSNSKALSVGTGSNADVIPSLMETFLKVDTETKLVVEHQVGDQVKDIYLQVNGNGSIWHINARIAIQRL
ncbi:hypothetical protein [Mycobacterium angelicum]|uniref:Uncharacterized protein n=1 Tax=Mycobacterium angelicum TaxID=470074 RepID=A0A1W9ZSE6_MYCAN|nr:hypothetical protein [Mycobacterium angelicum]MCV7195553.1 hypothetical protein [Mycobacterium angelicum]ORA20575.1 hypothetical protein BST12_14840 [Mycobacterium angelicum]